MERLSANLRTRLLRLARASISQRLGGCGEKPEGSGDEPLLQERLATFVTLKTGGKLRGCIGNLEPLDTLAESVSRNSVSAAFHDHRFTPLTREELADVEIEISVLTPPEPLEYRDGDELREKLRPGVDGVILRHGRNGATFLPQVWEQLPEPNVFLDHLCLKAGLSRKLWNRDHPEISVYQVEHFGECETVVTVIRQDIERELAALYEEMECAYDKVARKLGHTCDGCPDNCCDSYFTHHTYLEWAYLWRGMETLDGAKRKEIIERAGEYEHRAREMIDRDERPVVMCPLNEAGRCVLYRYRLMVCRTHGVPASLTRPDGRTLRFPGCFRCQELVERRFSGQTDLPFMERTHLLRRLVSLEQRFLKSNDMTPQRLRMTIGAMLVGGPPGRNGKGE